MEFSDLLGKMFVETFLELSKEQLGVDYYSPIQAEVLDLIVFFSSIGRFSGEEMMNLLFERINLEIDHSDTEARRNLFLSLKSRLDIVPLDALFSRWNSKLSFETT